MQQLHNTVIASMSKSHSRYPLTPGSSSSTKYLPFLSTISTNNELEIRTTCSNKSRSTRRRKKRHSVVIRRKEEHEKAMSSCIDDHRDSVSLTRRGIHDTTHSNTHAHTHSNTHAQNRGIAEMEVDLFLRLGLVNHSTSTKQHDMKRDDKWYDQNLRTQNDSHDVDSNVNNNSNSNVNSNVKQKENRQELFPPKAPAQRKRVSFIDPLVTKMRQPAPFEKEDLPHLFYSEEELDIFRSEANVEDNVRSYFESTLESSSFSSKRSHYRTI